MDQDEDRRLPLSAVSTLIALRNDPVPAVATAARSALAVLRLDNDAAAAAGVAAARRGYRPVRAALDEGGPEEEEAARRLSQSVKYVLAQIVRHEDFRGLKWLTGSISESPLFSPDLLWLARLHRWLLAESDPYAQTLLAAPKPDGRRDSRGLTLRGSAPLLRRIVAWIISRAGMLAILERFDEDLRSPSTFLRYSTAVLVADTAVVIDDDGYLGHYEFTFMGATDQSITSFHTRGPTPPATHDHHLDTDVQFTLYRPRVIQPERWFSLVAFVHRSSPFIDEDGVEVDPIAEVTRQASGILGARMGLYGAVAQDSAAALPRGNEIVFEPWIEVGQINPPRTAVRWEEPIHRVEFRLQVPGNTDGRRLRGGMRVYLGVLLIAELGFICHVMATALTSTTDAVERVRAVPYRRIFASYSHHDAEIVKRVRAAAAAVGDRYLIDVDELRAGEVWEKRIADLITDSDIFQLFWSSNSMRSPYVRNEWEHALSLNRPEFVRPVYWEQPRPQDLEAGLPPASLGRLHFRRLESDVIPRSRRVPPTARPAPTGGLGYQARSPQGAQRHGRVPPSSLARPRLRLLAILFVLAAVTLLALWLAGR